MSDELSDEAAENAMVEMAVEDHLRPAFKFGWQECRRRATVMIYNEIEHCAELRMDLESRISDLEALIEKERRKAFEAGINAYLNADSDDLEDDHWRDEAYRAYTEAAKEEKGAPKAEQPCWKCGATKEIK